MRRRGGAIGLVVSAEVVAGEEGMPCARLHGSTARARKRGWLLLLLCRARHEGPQSPLLLELAPHAATESGGETAGTQIAGSVLWLAATAASFCAAKAPAQAARNGHFGGA